MDINPSRTPAIVASPLYANVPPASYWPALSQYVCPGGYKAKTKAGYSLHAARPCVCMNTSFFVSLQYPLFAKPVDCTATDTTYLPPGCWKSCGICMSGYSCCLVGWGRGGGKCDRAWSLQNWPCWGRDRPQQLLMTRKHGSIYNINIRRKAGRQHLLFSMIN